MHINVRDLMASGLTAQEAFQQAFDICRSHPVVLPNVGQLSASGVVYVPAGIYELSDSLEIPLHVHLVGEGETSALTFENGGLEMPRQVTDPDENGDVYSTQVYSSSLIRDLALANVNPDNLHAGFDMLGGAGVHIERIYSFGWQNHYLLDQAGLVTITGCYLGGINFPGRPVSHENGIVFQNPPRPPITKGGSANVNSVSRCCFNLAGNPIIFQGDTMFVVDQCYVNGGAPIIIGGNRAVVRYCTFEAIGGTECILVEAPGELGAISLEIKGCFFAADIAAVRFDTAGVVGLTFNDNVAHTNNVVVDGVVTEERHVLENLIEFPRQLQGPLIVLGNRNWGDSAMVANDGLSEAMLYASSATGPDGNSRDRVGIGTIQPQAVLDVWGADEGGAATPQYGFQIRTENGTVFRIKMVHPGEPPEQPP